jgi:Subtilase family
MRKPFFTVGRRCRRIFLSLTAVGLFTGIALSGAFGGGSDLPANIDHALRQFLVSGQTAAQASATPATGGTRKLRGARGLALRDAQGRVLVDIHLNGKVPIADMRSLLISAGAKIVAENSSYRRGVISVFVPVSGVADLARSPGVLSISLARRPRTNIGLTTSGGVYVIHSDVLNAMGLDGTGETVGVLSDSYDTAQITTNGDPLTIHAADDVASGDLPGVGNPQNPNPVVVLEDFPSTPDSPTIDEGRAMLQIVHDVAPAAKLAFATAFVSKVDFANNIRRLRTDANCDVIVDDVIYTEEPMFSDGIIAQAVDDVVTSSTLAGPKCVYFSSAGNFEGGGYTATFSPVSDAIARAGLPNQNLKLDQVPAGLTTGGFHNFNPDPTGPVDISQQFSVDADDEVEFDLQWNDPFDIPGGVTTDYNILIFDADGNFLASFSGTSDNFMTQEPIEDVLLDNFGDAAVYQIAISRAGTSPATPVAQKLRYLAIDNFGGIGADEYYQPKAPATFGHSCANGALGTAAYVYTDSPTVPVAPPFFPFIEDFSSAGPSTIDFDAAGNRLAQSQIRLKPDIAAPDGGNTTFFGDDYEGDGFPNFFGTSAAAPHAAGIAALLLQKAGGPGSLTMAQVKNILQSSVSMEHDLDPFFSHATATGSRRDRGRHGKRFSGATVTVTGSGNDSNASSRDPNFFTITYATNKRGETLTSITIDLTNAGLDFDTTIGTGFPLTLGRLVNINPRDVIAVIPPGISGIPSITLFFARGAFTPATSVSFGIDRDFIGDAGGNNGDYLEGGVFTATTTKNNLKGTFVNEYGFGYTIADGFGLIDGQKAAQLVP